MTNNIETQSMEENKARLFSLVSTLLSGGSSVLDQSQITIEWLFDAGNGPLVNEAFRELTQYASAEGKASAYDKIVDVKNILGFDSPGWLDYLK